MLLPNRTNIVMSHFQKIARLQIIFKENSKRLEADLFLLFSTDVCSTAELGIWESHSLNGPLLHEPVKKHILQPMVPHVSFLVYLKELKSNIFIDSLTYNIFCKDFWVNNRAWWIYYEKKSHRNTKTVIDKTI